MHLLTCLLPLSIVIILYEPCSVQYPEASYKYMYWCVWYKHWNFGEICILMFSLYRWPGFTIWQTSGRTNSSTVYIKTDNILVQSQKHEPLARQCVCVCVSMCLCAHFVLGLLFCGWCFWGKNTNHKGRRVRIQNTEIQHLPVSNCRSQNK